MGPLQGQQREGAALAEREAQQGGRQRRREEGERNRKERDKKHTTSEAGTRGNDTQDDKRAQFAAKLEISRLTSDVEEERRPCSGKGTVPAQMDAHTFTAFACCRLVRFVRSLCVAALLHGTQRQRSGTATDAREEQQQGGTPADRNNDT
jgi:hypothetical protein